MGKKCQFLAQISVFWVATISLCPPFPFLPAVHFKKDLLQAMEPIEQVFQGRQCRETHFTPENGHKLQIFSQNQCFLGPTSRLVLCPPFLRLSDVLHDIEAILQLFTGHIDIFVQNWQKNQQCAESAM